jgi:hypothetical protein
VLNTSVKMSLRLAVGMMLIASSSFAQSSAIPVSDPDVFAAFLRMHHSIVSTSGGGGSNSSGPSANSAQPAPPSSLGWQKHLGLSDADFAKLDVVYSDLNRRVNGVRAEALQYASTHPSSADSTVLMKFRDRELVAVKDGIAALRSQLSIQGANSLFAIIDGEFRASVTRTSVGQAK